RAHRRRADAGVHAALPQDPRPEDTAKPLGELTLLLARPAEVLDGLSFGTNATRCVRGGAVRVADITCSRCKSTVEYHRAYCHCGRFVGYPNIRRAEEMRADLDQNYDKALADASTRGAQTAVDALEDCLKGTIATINVDVKILYNLAAGGNYLS